MSIWQKFTFVWMFLLMGLLQANELNPLKIVYNAGTPPLKFTHDNQPQGMLIDIWKLWAKKTGYEVVFIEAQWDETLTMIADGRADIHVGLYHTIERENFLDFSHKPLFENKNYFFYHVSLGDFETIDLKPYRVGIGNGYPVNFMDQHYPEVSVKSFDSNEAMIKALRDGSTKVVLSALPTFLYSLKSNNIDINTMQYNPFKPVFVENYRGAVKKGNATLLKRVDEGFEKITAEELKEIEQRWTTNLHTDFFSNRFKSGITLTQEEEKWLEEHKTLIVGNQVDWAPYDFSLHGQPAGFSNDYIKLVAKIAGFDLKFVSGTWNELVKKFDAKEIDVLHTIHKIPERTSKYLYSQAYVRPKYVIAFRDDGKKIDTIESLKGKRIALAKNWAASNRFKTKYPQIKVIEYDHVEHMLNDLSKGSVDAVLDDSSSIEYSVKKEHLLNIEIAFEVDLFEKHSEQDFYLATHKDMILLDAIMTKAMQAISEKELEELQQKWFVNALNDDTMKLSDEEINWLSRHRVIRYSEVNWEPLSIIENGRMKGIIGDYLDIVAEKTGITFEFVPSRSWPDVLDKFKKGEIDLIPGIGSSHEEAYLGHVSNQYARYPMVMVSHEGISYIKSINDVKQKIFTMPQYYTSYNYIKEKYPEIKVIETADIPEALRNVVEKKADIFVGHIAPTLYHLEKLGLSNLKVVGNTDFEFTHHFLIQKNYPELHAIVNKVFATLSQKEKDKIYHEWVHTELKAPFDYTLLYKAGFAILVLFGFFAFYNQKINLQKRFVQTLLDSQEQLIITNNGQEIVTGNRAFMDFFGVASVNTFMSQYHAKCICDLFNTKAPSGFLQKMMGEQKWIDYVIENQGNGVYKAMILKENKNFIFSVTAADLPGKEGLKSAVFTDITFIENAKIELENMYKHTHESIEYASLIQHAIIPPDELFEQFFTDSFTLWEPKDIVGGDIYLFEKLRHEEECLVMLIDCTGHGVPGAFVTMLVKAIEQLKVSYIMNSDERVSPAKILAFLNQNMKHLLKQEDKNASSNAGFDGAIVYVNTQEGYITYAGAQLPLFYIEDNELKIIKGDRHSVGYKNSDALFEFTEHTLHVKENMTIYLSTDGFLDQIGGEQQFSFGKRRFGELVYEHFQKPMQEQKRIFKETLSSYQGSNDRNDDVTMVGFRL